MPSHQNATKSFKIHDALIDSRSDAISRGGWSMQDPLNLIHWPTELIALEIR
jgi:hypothetical protein